MFDAISVNKFNDENLLDIGRVGELLVFYQKVIIIANEVDIAKIIHNLGGEQFRRLSELGRLKTILNRGINAVPHPGRDGLFEYYRIRLMKDAGIEYEDLDRIAEHLKKLNGRRSASSRIINNCANFISLDTPDSLSGKITSKIAIEDLANEEILNNYMFYFTNGQSVGSKSRCIRISGDKFAMESNFDWDRFASRSNGAFANGINAKCHLILNFIQASEAFMSSVNFCSDGAYPAEISDIIKMKHRNLLLKYQNSISQIEIFQESQIGGGKNIRSIINKGEKTLEDVAKLITENPEFSRWTGSIPNDSHIIREYVKAISSQGWINSLPGKSFKFLLMAGVGASLDLLPFSSLAKQATSLGISFGETFMLDKLINGWRPNHFVDGPLRNFVEEPKHIDMRSRKPIK